MATTRSARTPSTSTHTNMADNIERYLQQDGHRTWGLVIYRCTYESDADWETFMDRFRTEIRNSLEYYNGLDMMDRLSMTVIQDRTTLDDASTSAVREHFRQWAATAAQEEQGAGPALSQRYRYCIQVDEDALQSVVSGPPPRRPRKLNDDAFVNLIWKDWVPADPDDEEEDEDGEDEIEGCTMHDVGWMMVGYQAVMVDFYYQLRDQSAWYTEYRRPPEIVVG